MNQGWKKDFNNISNLSAKDFDRRFKPMQQRIVDGSRGKEKIKDFFNKPHVDEDSIMPQHSATHPVPSNNNMLNENVLNVLNLKKVDNQTINKDNLKNSKKFTEDFFNDDIIVNKKSDDVPLYAQTKSNVKKKNEICPQLKSEGHCSVGIHICPYLHDIDELQNFSLSQNNNEQKNTINENKNFEKKSLFFDLKEEMIKSINRTFSEYENKILNNEKKMVQLEKENYILKRICSSIVKKSFFDSQYQLYENEYENSKI